VSWLEQHPTLHRVLALIAMYGRGDFSTPPFVYQGF
jgi:hypothetical protein